MDENEKSFCSFDPATLRDMKIRKKMKFFPLLMKRYFINPLKTKRICVMYKDSVRTAQ